MKKFLSILCVLILICISAVMFVACNKGNGNLDNDVIEIPIDPQTYSMYVPDGATTMAVANIIAGNGKFEVDTVNVKVSNAQEVQAKVLSGEADMAILPTNMAANLYNKGIQYKLVSVNVQGLLYVVGRNNITSLEDLKGKVIYSIGKSNTPEYVFKKVLTSKGIEFVDGDTAQSGKVVIKYVNGGSEVLPKLISGKEVDYALLGEPAVSTALSKSSELKVVADLQKEWQTVTGLQEGYPQAGLFVKASIIDKNKPFIEELTKFMLNNKDYLLKNIDTLNALFSKAGSTELKSVTFTTDLIERCNLQVYSASDAHDGLVEYFNVLYQFNSASVGGKLPDDGFYYGYGK